MGVAVDQLSPKDEGEFVAAVLASRALHRPWIDPPDTPERFAAYLEHSSREDQAVYVVRHDSCGGLVGYVSVGNIVRRAFQSAYLGYGAFEGHARQGLMSAGLRASSTWRSVSSACTAWRRTSSRPMPRRSGLSADWASSGRGSLLGT